MNVLIFLLSLSGIWLWPFLWFKWIKKHIAVEISFERQEVRPGEEIPMVIQLRNSSWLPCPYLRVSFRLPDGLSSESTKVNTALSIKTYLLMRQTLRIRTNLYAVSRGLKRIDEGLLHLNEGLGIRDFYLRQEVRVAVTVLPDKRYLQVPSMDIRNLVNDLETQHNLQPDESRLRGIRPYQWGDPLKHVAWSVVARTGTLMVKEFPSSTEWNITLLVNVQMYEPYYMGTHRQAVDTLCAMATDAAFQLEHKGAKLHLITNAITPGDPFRAWHGQQRAVGIRSILGRVQANASMSRERVIDIYPRVMRPPATLYIFTNQLNNVEKNKVQHFIRRGYTVQIFGEAEIRRLLLLDEGNSKRQEGVQIDD